MLPTLAELEANYLFRGFYLEKQFDYPDLSADDYDMIRRLITLLANHEDERVSSGFKEGMLYDKFYYFYYRKLVEPHLGPLIAEFPDYDFDSLLDKITKVKAFHRHKDRAIEDHEETKEITPSDISDPDPPTGWIRFYTKTTEPYPRR